MNLTLSQGRGIKGCQISDKVIDRIDTKKELASLAGVSHDTIAVNADEIISVIRQEAKERQKESGGDRKSEEYKKTVTEKIQEPIESAEEIASMFNTNSKYVYDAEKLKKEKPRHFPAAALQCLNVILSGTGFLFS